MTANANWPEHIQQKSAAVCFTSFSSPYPLQLYLCTLASKVAHFIMQEASPWLPFYIHAFIGSKFCPSLIDDIRLRILCHNIETSPSFPWQAENAPPLDMKQLRIWYVVIYIHIYIYMYVSIYIYIYTHIHSVKE